MEKMGKIQDLIIGECRLMVCAFANRRANAIPKPVSQDDSGTNQIRPAVRSLHGASVTVDAVLRVNEFAAIRCGIIDALPLGGPCLRSEHGRKEEVD